MGENIDILAFLEEVMRANTTSYQEDFQYDVKKLTSAALAQDKEDRSFLWMCRPCGTWCLNEHSVFIKESTESITWTHYEYEADHVKAYRVVITGQADGRPIGTVCPVDYKRHVLFVKKNAVPAESVTLTFKSGQTITFPYEQVKNHFGPIKDQYGTIIKIHYTAQDERVLEVMIAAEQRQTESESKQKLLRRRSSGRSKKSKPGQPIRYPER